MKQSQKRCPKQYASAVREYHKTGSFKAFTNMVTCIAKSEKEFTNSSNTIMSRTGFFRLFRPQHFKELRIQKMWDDAVDEFGTKLEVKTMGKAWFLVMPNDRVEGKESAVVKEKRRSKTEQIRRGHGDSDVDSISGDEDGNEKSDKESSDPESSDGPEESEDEEPKEDDDDEETSEEAEQEEEESEEQEGEDSEESEEQEGEESEESEEEDAEPIEPIEMDKDPKTKRKASSAPKAASPKKKKKPADSPAPTPPTIKKAMGRPRRSDDPDGACGDEQLMDAAMDTISTAPDVFEDSSDMWDIQRAIENVVKLREHLDKVTN